MPIATGSSARRHALRRPARAVLPLLLAAALGLGAGTGVHAAELKSNHHFEIPAQSLATALNALAKQSGVQVMSSGVDLVGLQVPGVAGDYTLEQALEMLLADTGLEYAVSGTNTIVVRSRAPQRRTPAAEPQASRDGASEPGVHTLDGVIVTAEKRTDPVSSVPMGISVITEDMLERTQINSVDQLAGAIPGFAVAGSGRLGFTTLSMRGIAPMGYGASVATYIDEVPLTSNNAYAFPSGMIFDMLPYDLQGMEVLRGPQGTLYGASALGGILKYTTRKPELGYFEGRAGAGFEQVRGGGDLGWAVRGSINAPLAGDRIALRIGYARKEVPGWINAVRRGDENTNESSQEVIRASLLWKFTENASLLLSATRQNGRQGDSSGIFLDTATWKPVSLEYGNLYWMANETKEFGNDLYSATLDIDLGWADLMSSTSYMDAYRKYVGDNTYTFGDFLPLVGMEPGLLLGIIEPDYTKLVQEVRLTSKRSDRFEWLVGGFYTDEDINFIEDQSPRNEDGSPRQVATPLYVGTMTPRYRETAVFANATYKFTPRFDVSAGMRYARNKQDLNVGLTGLLVGGSIVQTGKSEEGVTTYSLAPRYFFNDDTMGYARYSTGYRAGGPNAPFPGIPQTQVNSDTIANYEVGLKRYFWERRAYLDVQAFHIDWKNLPVVLIHEGVGYGANGGGATSRGIELESRFLLTDAWSMGFSGSYIDASLDDPIPGQAGAGDPLPLTPDVTAAFTTQYDFRLGDWDAYVGGSYRHYGSVVTNVSPAEAYELPSYNMLDLNAGLNKGNWSIALYVRNATNELAYSDANAVRSSLNPANKLFINAVPAQPRTVGVAVDYRF